MATRTGAAPTTFGTPELDIQFKGEKFERIGPETYRLTDGGFSTCVQPTPRWYMTGSEGTVVLDKRVVLKNAVLRVKDVPLLYLPFIYYPINKEDRSTGFLMPSYSASTVARLRHQQRVLLGDRPQPGRDVLPHVVVEGAATRSPATIATPRRRAPTANVLSR